MNNQEQVFSTEWLGRTLTFKTGKLAKQADAAVTVQYGDTMVLATVVESKEERDISFFPLTVELEERLYAGGIIKGSQWIKREGRPSEDSILIGRMIDRSIRPLFDDSSRKETQIVLTILSVDHENPYDTVALIAASAALSISGVNWAGPIAGIRVAQINNEFVFNPTSQQTTESALDLIVAGTENSVIQIEAGANEIPENVMYDAIVAATKNMKEPIELINKMKSSLSIETKIKEENTMITTEEIEKQQEKDKALDLAKNWIKENINSILFDKSYYLKKERKAAVTAIKEGLKHYLFDNGLDKSLISFAVEKTVESAVDTEITRELIENKKRVDGRGITEIRSLSAEIDLLPRTHGNGLFSRGETQILSVVTLGGPGLAQTIEGINGNGEKRFMHHYNFAPFSVGETKPMRGPGRREIGHGALAEKALAPMIPAKDSFPYTIRVVSETLGSNGSSSMGSTCGSTLALMHAGVPIKKPVAGVAIGLASYSDMSAWQVITDIQDLEDGKGGMDFKITGTRDGITAIQLDTKTLGLNYEIIKEALKQGKDGRDQILNVIEKTISEPNKELSPYAPRIEVFKIDPDKIREVIGTGGKVINKIIDETGVSIDIEDDGTVMVCGTDSEKSKIAIDTIKNIVKEFEPGEIYTGKVVRMMDFGAFVEVLPGKDGLVHVSEMAPYRVNSPANMVEVGDIVQVRVKEIDDQGRVNLSMKGLSENEARWEEKKEEATKEIVMPQGFNRNQNGRSGNNRDRGPRKRF